jgi:hypothetical protein
MEEPYQLDISERVSEPQPTMPINEFLGKLGLESLDDLANLNKKQVRLGHEYYMFRLPLLEVNTETNTFELRNASENIWYGDDENRFGLLFSWIGEEKMTISGFYVRNGELTEGMSVDEIFESLNTAITQYKENLQSEPEYIA